MSQGFPDKKPNAFVVVHGVGATKAGTMLRQLAGELGGPMEMAEVGKEHYPKVTLSSDKKFAAGFEVYWANLKPGGDSWLAKALRPFHVFLALSLIGGTGWGEKNQGIDESSVFGRIAHYYTWIVVLCLPSFYLPLLDLSSLTPYLGPFASLVTIAPTLFLSWQLARLDNAGRVALFLGPLLGICAFVIHYTAKAPDAGAEWSARILSLSYMGIIALTFLAGLELITKINSAKKKPLSLSVFVRFASLTLPFTIVGGVVGSILWAANVAVDYHYGLIGLNQWSQKFMAALYYDLALLEFAFAVSTAAFGLWIAFVFGRLYLSFKSKKAALDQSPSGLNARNGLATALIVLFAGNVAVSSIFAVNVMFYPNFEIYSHWPFLYLRDFFLWASGYLVDKDLIPAAAVTSSAAAIFTIYVASSTRVLSFIPSLFKTARTSAGVVADVILYLTPEGPLNYGTSARRNLVNLVKTLCPEFDVWVLGYSQGSVISIEGLAELDGSKVTLITAGSPMDSLYGRFLGIQPKRQPAATSWHNFYRPSDYIGGPVQHAENIDVPSDFDLNHLDYFHDALILAQLGR